MRSCILGGLQGHWSDLAGSDFMIMLATTYCSIFVIKTCCQDWGQMYLLQERGLSAYSATTYLNAMEVGGIIGCIILGAVTDFMIRKGYYFGTGKSPRMIIVQLCVAGSCMFLNLFLFTIDPDTSTVSTLLQLQYTATVINLCFIRSTVFIHYVQYIQYIYVHVHTGMYM